MCKSTLVVPQQCTVVAAKAGGEGGAWRGRWRGVASGGEANLLNQMRMLDPGAPSKHRRGNDVRRKSVHCRLEVCYRLIGKLGS